MASSLFSKKLVAPDPKKIYEINPLAWPKCQGKMRVVAFIENSDVIKKILNHLNLWDPKRPERHVAHAPTLIETATYDDPVAPSTEDYVADPAYPMDSYF